MFQDILLTVDFDRTLTAPDSTIPERNIEAIRYFMENGGTFTVNTGRSVPMTCWFRDAVPVNAPLLLYNGSAAYDTRTGELLNCRCIDLDPSQVLCDLQRRFPGLNLEVQGKDAHYALEKDPGWEDYCRHNRCQWGYITPDAVPAPFLKFALYGQFRENTVASMFQAEPEELALFDQAIHYIENTYGDRVDVFRAAPRIADVHAKGCSKLAAARGLQKQLGKKCLVCVGDAENDLSMLEGADHAFCPADGIIADRFETVCPCTDGAIADVIYKKIPEILAIEP